MYLICCGNKLESPILPLLNFQNTNGPTDPKGLTNFFNNYIRALKRSVCLGMRYALQTLNLAIIHTVRNFHLEKCDKTTGQD